MVLLQLNTRTVASLQYQVLRFRKKYDDNNNNVIIIIFVCVFAICNNQFI